jgi:CRISPR-associated protein Cmr1
VLKGGTALKATAAVQAGEEATLSLAVLDDMQAPRLLSALALMHLYGTLGGRGRNGWGSLALEPRGDTPPLAAERPADVARPWHDALQLDWPHALGMDQRLLAWRTVACADWRDAMRHLAEAKIRLRTRFPFTTGNTQAPEDRHWLSYPVTRHSVQSWEGGRDHKSLRLPNTLRFKLRPAPGGRVIGVIFHMPCKPPAAFRPDPATLERVWQQVHDFLDDLGNGLQLQRIPA